MNSENGLALKVYVYLVRYELNENEYLKNINNRNESFFKSQNKNFDFAKLTNLNKNQLILASTFTE